MRRGRVFVAAMAAALITGSALAARGDISTASGGGDPDDLALPALRVALDSQFNDLEVTHAGSEVYLGYARNDAFLFDAGRIRVLDVAASTISTPSSLNFPDVGPPAGFAQDPSGRLYFSDWTDGVVYLWDGATRTAVGGDPYQSSGFAGDGGPALGALMRNPRDLALDAAGNLFIADTNNHLIRRVTPGPDGIVNGGAGEIIATVAGTVMPEPNKGGVRGRGEDGVPATQAQLQVPHGLAVGTDGDLFIGDTYNNIVRRVEAGADGEVDGDLDEIITVVAGGEIPTVDPVDNVPAAQQTLSRPRDVEIAGGTLYVADSGHHRIVGVDLSNGAQRTVAGSPIGAFGYAGDGGPAASALLASPSGLSISSGGEIYIADTVNRRARRVDAAGFITTVAGSGEEVYTGDGGPAALGKYRRPSSVVAAPGGGYYVSDTAHRRVRFVDASGTISTVAGNGDSSEGAGAGCSPAARTSVADPQGLALDANGNLYIADGAFSRVRKIDALTGNIVNVIERNNGVLNDALTTARCKPRAFGPLGWSADVALDGAGNIFVSDWLYNVVWRLSPDDVLSVFAGTYHEAGFSGDGGPAAEAMLNAPAGLAVDASGNLFVSDSQNNRIRMIRASDGVITTVAGNGSTDCSDAYGFSGDGGPATSAALARPWDLTFSAAGDLVFADEQNHRVRRIAAGADGFVDADGDEIISTVAGDPESYPAPWAGCWFGGFSGDGGPASTARLWSPHDVAFDPSGNMLIADRGNGRIRRVEAGSL